MNKTLKKVLYGTIIFFIGVHITIYIYDSYDNYKFQKYIKESNEYESQEPLKIEKQPLFGIGYEIAIWESDISKSISIDIDYPEFISAYNNEIKNEFILLFSGAIDVNVSIENINDGNMQFLDDIIAVDYDNSVERYDFYFKFSEYRDEYYVFLKPLYSTSQIVEFDMYFGNFTGISLSNTISELVLLNKHFKDFKNPMQFIGIGGHEDDFGEYQIPLSDIEKLYGIYSLGLSVNIPGWDHVSYESRLEFLKNTPIQEYSDKRFFKWMDTIRERDSDLVHELGREHTEKYWPSK